MTGDRLKKLLDFLKSDPADPFLKYAIATEYLSLNDPDSALLYFEDLVKNNEGYTGTYYHLGKLYGKLGRKDDAILTYKKGMNVAGGARDNHALSELRTVYNSLMGLDYEDD